MIVIAHLKQREPRRGERTYMVFPATTPSDYGGLFGWTKQLHKATRFENEQAFIDAKTGCQLVEKVNVALVVVD